MKKVFEKYELFFVLFLIIAYIVVNSFCIQNFGIEDFRSTIINTIFSVCLIILIKVLKRTDYYGLIKPKNSKKFLFFIPLILIISVNL